MIGYIISAIVLLVIAFLIYRWASVSRMFRKINTKRFERMKPLVEKIDNDRPLTAQDVLPFALDLATREETYLLVSEHSTQEVFPLELISFEKAAEANLATWLEYPTALDAIPDEIEYLRRVTILVNVTTNFHYEVFRFRMRPPHWAADAWMLGVVGPYLDDSKPYDLPKATFSRLTKVGAIKPNDEAEWVHQNIALPRVQR